MSPIGRIFIVLNLILAALFLGWASLNLATSHEYKGKYEAEVTAKEAAAAEFEDQIATLRGELDTKRTEADDARRERDQAVAAAVNNGANSFSAAPAVQFQLGGRRSG